MFKGFKLLTYKTVRAGAVQPGEGVSSIYVQIMEGGARKEDGGRLSSMVPTDRTTGTGHKLKYRKFH